MKVKVLLLTLNHMLTSFSISGCLIRAGGRKYSREWNKRQDILCLFLVVRDQESNIMRQTASIRVGELAQLCTDPEVAESLMRKAINWGVQVNRRTVRMIKLERLLKCSVGTGKVESLAERLAVESRGGRNVETREKVKVVRRKVRMLMGDKLKDAVVDMELGRVQFNKSKKQLWKSVPSVSRVGQELRVVMREEMVFEWQEKMNQMQRSVHFLINKHRASRREKVPDTWRGIRISDQALGGGIQLPAPFLGESVGEVSDAAKEVLQLPPKTAVYSKISLRLHYKYNDDKVRRTK